MQQSNDKKANEMAKQLPTPVVGSSCTQITVTDDGDDDEVVEIPAPVKGRVRCILLIRVDINAE